MFRNPFHYYQELISLGAVDNPVRAVPPSGGMPAGNARSFVVPDRTMNAATIRRMLSRYGAHDDHLVTIPGVVMIATSVLTQRVASLAIGP